MNTDQLKNEIDNLWENRVIPYLCKYVEIPCKSPLFDPQWRENGHIHRAVALCKNWCKSLGFEGASFEILEIEQRTPLLFIDIPGVNDDHTALIYGHLDKQPEAQGWDQNKGPWQAVIEEEKLFGRGAADDGYALFCAMSAVAALKNQALSHPNIKLFIECSEESGSPDVSAYLNYLSDRIGIPDLILVLDSGCGNYEQLWVTTSLRGMISGKLKVKVLNEAVHSGDASGIVPSSFRVIRKILSRLEDPVNGEIMPDFLHDRIPENRMQEAKETAKIMGNKVFNKFPFAEGVLPLSKNLTSLVLNRTWRPTLCVTSAEGFPCMNDAANVIRPYTSFKLSVRIPPTLSANTANIKLKELLESNPPYNAQISYEMQKGGSGWNAPKMHNWLKSAVERASESFFNAAPAYMGEGGSIPLISMLGERYPNAQFIVTGVLGPNSNAHGPNESLHLPMVKNLSACIAKIFFDLSQLGK